MFEDQLTLIIIGVVLCVVIGIIIYVVIVLRAASPDKVNKANAEAERKRKMAQDREWLENHWESQRIHHPTTRITKTYPSNPTGDYPDVLIADVKGIMFRDPDEIGYAKEMDTGDKVTLLLDLDNPYDENAVKVMADGIMFIGYVDKKNAELVAPYIDSIKEARVASVTPGSKAPYIKIMIKFNWCKY